MKKLYFLAIFAISAIIFSMNVNEQKRDYSFVMLDNIEALACNECGSANHGPTADRFWSNTLYCKNENNVGCSY